MGIIFHYIHFCTRKFPPIAGSFLPFLMLVSLDFRYCTLETVHSFSSEDRFFPSVFQAMRTLLGMFCLQSTEQDSSVMQPWWIVISFICRLEFPYRINFKVSNLTQLCNMHYLLVLATSFGHHGPSSGKYHKNLKTLKLKCWCT